MFEVVDDGGRAPGAFVVRGTGGFAGRSATLAGPSPQRPPGTLPMPATGAAADAVAAPLPAVLVVEDEALVALLLADTLAEAGYRPVLAPDGRPGAAPDAAAAVVDLCLADGLDGRDVVRRLRARRPSLPVVVVTGFGPEAPEADLRGLGGPTLRLHKPFDCEGLPDRLREVLRAPAAPPGAGTAPRRRRSDRRGVAA